MHRHLALLLFLATVSTGVAQSIADKHDRIRRLSHYEDLEMLKLASDPRAEHRQRLLEEHNRRVLTNDIVFRHRIDNNQYQTESLDGEMHRDLKATHQDDKDKVFAADEAAFWERLMKFEEEKSMTKRPTRPPRPTNSPTRRPRPTEVPTRRPRPTDVPTRRPRPTEAPITPTTPTDLPTRRPRPTNSPTIAEEPTVSPVQTDRPTRRPRPTESPTRAPVESSPRPTRRPRPTNVPTNMPSPQPIETGRPTRRPRPTEAPVIASVSPTRAPTNRPTLSPTRRPRPTEQPTTNPTRRPSPSPIESPRPTPQPTLTRVEQIILSVALFGGGEFVDPASYQSQALNWLNDSETDNLSDARIIQRYSLACIFFATFAVSTEFTDDRYGPGIAPEWQTKTNWVTNENECSWARLSCNDNNQITTVDLFANLVTGEFPPEVVYLNETLTLLDVGKNLVTSEGSFLNPYLGWLYKLTDLRVDRTNFKSTDGVPQEISNMKDLKHFSCEGNLYKGPLNPAAFPSDLSQLTFLDIEANDYAGSQIPAEIGNLPALENFYVRDSAVSGNLNYMTSMQSIFQTFVDLNPQLSGTVPTEIGALTTLASFSATACDFDGSLPSEIGNLEGSVLNMYFFGNRFTGPIPSAWGRLTSMNELQIQNNTLDGLVPASICDNRDAALEILVADCRNCPTTRTCCSNCLE